MYINMNICMCVHPSVGVELNEKERLQLIAVAAAMHCARLESSLNQQAITKAAAARYWTVLYCNGIVLCYMVL